MQEGAKRDAFPWTDCQRHANRLLSEVSGEGNDGRRQTVGFMCLTQADLAIDTGALAQVRCHMARNQRVADQQQQCQGKTAVAQQLCHAGYLSSNKVWINGQRNGDQFKWVWA